MSFGKLCVHSDIYGVIHALNLLTMDCGRPESHRIWVYSFAVQQYYQSNKTRFHETCAPVVNFFVNHGRGISCIGIVVKTPSFLIKWLQQSENRKNVEKHQNIHSGELLNKTYDIDGQPRNFLHLNVYLILVLILIEVAPTTSIYSDIVVELITFTPKRTVHKLPLRTFIPKSIQMGVSAIMKLYRETILAIYATPMQRIMVGSQVFNPIELLMSQYRLYPFTATQLDAIKPTFQDEPVPCRKPYRRSKRQKTRHVETMEKTTHMQTTVQTTVGTIVDSKQNAKTGDTDQNADTVQHKTLNSMETTVQTTV